VPSCAWGVHNQHPCWCHGRLNAFPDASGAGCFVAVESDARSNIQHSTIHRHTDSDARLWSRVSQPNSTIKKLPFQEAPTPTEKSDAISARNKDTGPNPAHVTHHVLASRVYAQSILRWIHHSTVGQRFWRGRPLLRVKDVGIEMWRCRSL